MFSKLKVAELQKIAEDFGADVQPNAKKADLLAALDAEGVTWELYSMLNPPADDETETEAEKVFGKEKAKPKAADKIVLLKMQRANFSYEVEGYTFTREHPFVPVSEDAANYILRTEEGFYLATPEEVERYYS